MKPISRTSLCLAAMAALWCQAATVSAQEAPAPASAGQKIDSGLGDLPHYRDWADPTGKTPMLPMAVKVAGQKLDSGLGELPPYRAWTDPTGKLPMRLEQRVAGSDAR